jgi:two-component system, chemotaxis family, sensor kinase CheA
VVETLQVARDRITPIGAAEAFVLRDRTVPLVSLARALDLPGHAHEVLDFPYAGARSPMVNTVVTMVGGQLSALAVDRFGERLDVMLKPLDGLLAGMTGIAGTTVLGDGRVLIVLDLQELLK